MSSSTFETLHVTVPKPFVYHVELHRPKKRNALNEQMWKDISACFSGLNNNPDCRVVMLSGAGKMFTAGNVIHPISFVFMLNFLGLDMNSAMNLGPKVAEQDDVARKAKILYPTITLYQEAISSMEKCCKPVLSAVHSACIGAGVDIVTATDIRYCTKDAYYQVKEVRYTN